jgi:Domain of unknown function (DUF4184)
VPFTPTHALAAVPLSRVPGLMPSALVIGSLLPDLPMIIPGTPAYGTTHSFVYGVPYCLPFGVLAFVLFRLGRGPAIGFLPLAMRCRLARHAAPELHPSPRVAASLVASLALGVLSHIVWDGFTHAGRFGSELFPALQEPWARIAGRPWLGSSVLQFASSVLGLPLLGLIVVRWYLREAPAPSDRVPKVPRPLSWLAMGLVSAIPLFALGIAHQRALSYSHDFWAALAYHAVTLTMRGYLVAAVGLTLLPRLFAARLEE